MPYTFSAQARKRLRRWGEEHIFVVVVRSWRPSEKVYDERKTDLLKWRHFLEFGPEVMEQTRHLVLGIYARVIVTRVSEYFPLKFV